MYSSGSLWLVLIFCRLLIVEIVYGVVVIVLFLRSVVFVIVIFNCVCEMLVDLVSSG